MTFQKHQRVLHFQISFCFDFTFSYLKNMIWSLCNECCYIHYTNLIWYNISDCSPETGNWQLTVTLLLLRGVQWCPVAEVHGQVQWQTVHPRWQLVGHPPPHHPLSCGQLTFPFKFPSYAYNYYCCYLFTAWLICNFLPSVASIIILGRESILPSMNKQARMV